MGSCREATDDEAEDDEADRGDGNELSGERAGLLAVFEMVDERQGPLEELVEDIREGGFALHGFIAAWLGWNGGWNGGRGIGRLVGHGFACFGCYLLESEKSERGMDHRVIEAAFEGIGAEELDLEPRRSEEGAKDPGDLGADKEVARQPGEEGLDAGEAGLRKLAEEAEEFAVRDDASQGDGQGVGEEGEGVTRTGVGVVGGWGVEGEEEGDRAEGSQDEGHDGETSEQELEALAKPDSAAQDKAEHAVEESIHEEGEEDRGREFDADVCGHFPSPPEPDGGPIEGQAYNDEGQADADRSAPDPGNPGLEHVSVPTAEGGDRGGGGGGGVTHLFVYLTLCVTKFVFCDGRTLKLSTKNHRRGLLGSGGK